MMTKEERKEYNKKYRELNKDYFRIKNKEARKYRKENDCLCPSEKDRKRNKFHSRWLSLQNKIKGSKKYYNDIENQFNNYESFIDWCNENYYEVPNEEMNLDKDLFGNGKIYSENTCCFLPKSINLLIRKKYLNIENINKLKILTEKYKEYLPKKIYEKLLTIINN